MKNELQRLIDLARKHTITPSEHQAQVRSFTYGNTRIENESITRDDVDRVVTKLNGQVERSHNQSSE